MQDLQEKILPGMAFEDLAVIALEEKRAHLRAHGRIRGEDPIATTIKYNTRGSIDGARFFAYNPDTKAITIRVDHSEIPEFWLEVEFTKEKLQEWLDAVQ